jgi:hypothetical protein
MPLELTSAKSIENVFKDICDGCKTFDCCAHCYGSDGHYFPDLDPKKLQALKDKYGWNKKGFLGDKGCLLPVELRSEMCLTWICPERRTKEREELVKASYITTTEEVK